MTTKKKRKKKMSKGRIALIVALVVAAVLAVVAMPYVMTGADKEAMIYLRKGTTTEALKDSLTAKLGESYAGKVMTLLSLTGAEIEKRHGAFRIGKGDSPLKAARRLRSGAQSGIKFTFNNVRTKKEFAERAGKLYMMGYDSIWSALNDPKLCAKFGRTPNNIVGILMPDSYEFYWDVSPMKLLETMNDYHDKFWNSEGRKAKAEKLGLTPDEVEIIASITEEETSKADERGKVGRLYINRFKSGMRLQADPTVKYALGDFSIKRLTHDMLQVQSEWNTYRVNGLPPGPIRLPEKATIDAILNSTPHNYTYMCAKEDFSGYHNFTTSYDEHLANAHRYQDALNARNIK
jgi:UPF0755 protein